MARSRLLLCGVAMLALAGCGSDASGGSSPGADDFVGTWVPAPSADTSSTTAVDAASISIRIEPGGKIALSGPCNIRGATYKVDEAGLHVRSGGSSTLVGCGLPEPSVDPEGPLTLNAVGDLLSEPTSAGTLTFVRAEPRG